MATRTLLPTLAAAALLALATLPAASAATPQADGCLGGKGPVVRAQVDVEEAYGRAEDLLDTVSASSAGAGRGVAAGCLGPLAGECPDGRHCGECQGQIVTAGGPIVCNLQNQYLCDDTYDPDCSDEARTCRGADGSLRTDIDADRDGQCDSDADVDDDDDGVPDRCDDHPSNQDPIQEMVDYAYFYFIRNGYCPP